MKRRQFLRNLCLGGLGAAAGTAFYTFKIEPHWVDIVRRPLPVAHLPAHLVGKTLIQISDIHVGRLVDPHYLRSSLRRAAALQPDFVVYTGDFVSYDTVEQIDQLTDVMAAAPTGRLGTAAVLGNHDYGHGWQQEAVASRIAAQLRALGIPVLRNQVVDLDGLTIVGLDDLWGTNYDPAAAWRSVRPKQPAIALCHNPDAADLDIWQGFQGWILAGHTHGGQCKPPFLPPPILPVSNRRYAAGEIDLFDGRRLYINRGLGYVMQARFNARPEVTVFTLIAERM